MQSRNTLAAEVGLAAAAVATAATYSIRAIHPWPHSPLNAFLATFGHANAAVWPAQVVWNLAALAMIGLALWPPGTSWSARRSSQLICALAGVYSAWIGIGYFAWQMPGMKFSWLWAAVFTLQGALFVVAGVVRSDLVIRPGRNLASVAGAAVLCYALVGYPLIGMLGGHSLRALPVIGLSPCATTVFFFGLLLWARPPAPGYVMLVPLAWALGAAPPDLARGVAADYGMLAAAPIAAGLIIWRDRASWPAGQTLTAGLLLALMIGWSGHEDVLNGIALVALAVTAALAIRAGRRLPRARPAARARTGQLKVS